MHATQAHHAEEVLDVVFPANYQPPKVMEPGKKSFHAPTPAVAPQRTSILRGFPALSAMRCDHLDGVAVSQISVQAVAVVGLVADQSRGESVEEAVPQDPFDKLTFMREALSILTARGRL